MDKKHKVVLAVGIVLIIGTMLYEQGGGGINPFDGGGQKPSVFIIYDPATKTSLPGSMIDSWDSEEVALWMKDNVEDFIVQNKDADFSDPQYDKFKEVLEKYPPERYPWCYISNGKKGPQGDPPIDGKSLISETKKWVPK